MPRSKRVFSRRTLFQRINALPGGPYILVFISLALIVGVGFVAVRFVVPGVRGLIRPEYNEMPLPARSEQPYDEAHDSIREVLLNMGEYRNIGMPVLSGDRIYFTSGREETTRNPQLKRINYRSVDDPATGKAFPGIKAKMPWNEDVDPEKDEAYHLLQNDNIVYLDVQDDNILYFDGKSGGGGLICYCYNNGTEYEAVVLKEVYYGTPEVKLTGECAVWLERTGQNEDKLYMMDVNTKELTTLAVFESSPFGLSQPGVSSPKNGYGYVVWADYDDQYPDNENFSTIRVRSIPYSEEMSVDYPVDMYVHDPVTNGEALAWSDGNEGENSTLFLSVDRGMPKLISENVSYHGLGDNFLAWCENGNVWAYYYREDRKVRITRPSEMAMMVDVAENGVVWFDITEVGEYKMLDILKFALLDEQDGEN